MRLLRNILDYLAGLLDNACRWEDELDSHCWQSKMEILGRLANRR